jgi:hypothetical protein
VSFYVSTATFFLLHCDELDRVVALPRHKFVTGATLLQLGCGALKLWSHFCYMLGGVGYSNCGATFTACSEVWGIEIVESLLLHARRCGVLKLWSHFCYMLGGVGYSNCGATFTVCSEVCWYSNCGVTFTVCAEVWGIEIAEPLLLHARRCGVLKLRSHFYCMLGCGVLKLWSHFYCILGVVGY